MFAGSPVILPGLRDWSVL